MKGDFSRDSFDPGMHATRVMMQQGRVQLDADWNEQASIVLHRLETLVRDTFGRFCGPDDHCGFALSPIDDGDADFEIGAGRYYVDGLLVENRWPHVYGNGAGARLERGHSYIIYLDVWEEFIAPLQDAALIDAALDHLDTTARTRVEWRVCAQRVPKLPTRQDVTLAWPAGYLKPELVAPPGRLAARSGYHGADNHLYRVEIHDPGTADDGATFKWSRDNGAVTFAIHSIADKIVTLPASAREAPVAIGAGDWVEIFDDDDVGAEKPARPLFAVAQVDGAARTVTLETTPGFAFDAAKHPVLRRWDQCSLPIPVVERAGDDRWTELENGVAVCFAPPEAGNAAAVYRTGDYWTIPARMANGGTLLWPQRDDGGPVFREPAGVRHHYAPLAGIHLARSGKLTFEAERHDYRHRFRPLPDREHEQHDRHEQLEQHEQHEQLEQPGEPETPETPETQPPLVELLGIEAEHARALAFAEIHTLEHVAESLPEKIAHALAAWKHIDPEMLIARARHILHRDEQSGPKKPDSHEPPQPDPSEWWRTT